MAKHTWACRMALASRAGQRALQYYGRPYVGPSPWWPFRHEQKLHKHTPPSTEQHRLWSHVGIPPVLPVPRFVGMHAVCMLLCAHVCVCVAGAWHLCGLISRVAYVRRWRFAFVWAVGIVASCAGTVGPCWV